VLFPQVKTSSALLAYIAGITSAFVVAGTLFRLLEPMRKGGMIARFFARVWIIGSFYFTLSVVMVLVAGPYVFAGPGRRGAAYNSNPTTFRETILTALGLGILGAFFWPLVTKARNYPSDM
jgi:hypothetical protein